MNSSTTPKRVPPHLAKAALELATVARQDPAYSRARVWLETAVLRGDRPRTRVALVLVRSVCQAMKAAEGEQVDERVMAIALADLGIEIRFIRGSARCNIRESNLCDAAAAGAAVDEPRSNLMH